MPAALLPSDRPAVCAVLQPLPDLKHGISSQAVLTTPALRVTLFRFAAGQELSEHTSPARVLGQALAGRGVFTVEGKDHEMRAGDLLHMPPGAPHAVRAVEDFTLLLTQAFPGKR